MTDSRQEKTDRPLLEFPSDVAFTPAVKELQSQKGSRRAYARMEQGESWCTAIDEKLAAFIAAQTSFYLATANDAGQPYVQHRGGPAGFLRVLDETTLGFADFSGNRQYISLGNLAENRKVHLFLMDYAHRHRVKIWGEATVVEGDATLNDSLRCAGYPAKIERSLIIKVSAWDANCNQHIPQRFDAADVQAAIAERDKKIADLEAEIRRMTVHADAVSVHRQRP